MTVRANQDAEHLRPFPREGEGRNWTLRSKRDTWSSTSSTNHPNGIRWTRERGKRRDPAPSPHDGPRSPTSEPTRRPHMNTSARLSVKRTDEAVPAFERQALWDRGLVVVGLTLGEVLGTWKWPAKLGNAAGGVRPYRELEFPGESSTAIACRPLFSHLAGTPASAGSS